MCLFSARNKARKYSTEEHFSPRHSVWKLLSVLSAVYLSVRSKVKAQTFLQIICNSICNSIQLKQMYTLQNKTIL